MNSVEADATLSVDPEAVTDEPENSVLAFLDISIAVVGLLAIVEPWLVPVPIAAILLGLVIRFFAKSWILAPLSTTLASISIVLGILSAVAGLSLKQIDESRRDAMAINVANEYVNSLAKGDVAKAIKMSGLPPLVQDNDATTQDNKLTQEQKAIRNFLLDPSIESIRSRGSKGEWIAKDVVNATRYGDVTTIQVNVFDKNQVNQRPYIVSIQMRVPGKYAPDNKIRWVVSSIDLEGSFNP